MRTTLTLDPDVARALDRLRKERGLGLKEAVNEVLRRGLAAGRKAPGSRKLFRTRSVDHGRPLTGSFDNIAEVLEIVEREGFK